MNARSCKRPALVMDGHLKAIGRQHTPETASTRVVISSVFFWPSKSCTTSQRSSAQMCGPCILFDLRRGFELVAGARRPYRLGADRLRLLCCLQIVASRSKVVPTATLPSLQICRPQRQQSTQRWGNNLFKVLPRVLCYSCCAYYVFQEIHVLYKPTWPTNEVAAGNVLHTVPIH